MAGSQDLLDVASLRQGLGEGYARFPEAEQTQHFALLGTVRRPDGVALHVEPKGAAAWRLTLCTSDCVGALSIIAGLFTAYRLNIVNADIFTVHMPAPAITPRRGRGQQGFSRPLQPRLPLPPERRILDIFDVEAIEGPAPEIWDRFRQDLARLVSLLAQGNQHDAREYIITRMSALPTAPVSDSPLFPVSIEVSNDASPDTTCLVIRSPDTSGFLFAFTNALATLDANIERAEVRTIRGEVRDTFWLTDRSGHKIISQDRLHQLRAATVLIKQFTHLLPRSANPAQALRQFHSLASQMLSRADWTEQIRGLESTSTLETLAELMGVSRFLWEDFLRMQHENLFPVLLDMPALDERQSKDSLRSSLHHRLLESAEPLDRTREIKRFRDREMFRIDLRHITRRIDFREFARELSDLAEVVIGEAAELAHQDLQRRFGPPTMEDGTICPWCICALGKFGGQELGFGSDVELIFVYEGDGNTPGPEKASNAQYFEDFVRAMSGALTAQREGVFELDLRLRPHGNAGPLASSFSNLERYYSETGPARQFERMALVKLRPVAGDSALGDRVMKVRDQFVYSAKPLDTEGVLHLRRRQALELVPSGAISAKYSPGGLVDVEYSTQLRQIAGGHEDAAVRASNTLEAIQRLIEGAHISREQGQRLMETYGFLRRLIDALRVVRGHAKDLTIPAAESREFAYLARRLQYESPAAFQASMLSHMRFAQSVWEQGFPGKTA